MAANREETQNIKDTDLNTGRVNEGKDDDIDVWKVHPQVPIATEHHHQRGVFLWGIPASRLVIQDIERCCSTIGGLGILSTKGIIVAWGSAIGHFLRRVRFQLEAAASPCVGNYISLYDGKAMLYYYGFPDGLTYRSRVRIGR
jgi:hypothetical protein